MKEKKKKLVDFPPGRNEKTEQNIKTKEIWIKSEANIEKTFK